MRVPFGMEHVALCLISRNREAHMDNYRSGHLLDMNSDVELSIRQHAKELS